METVKGWLTRPSMPDGTIPWMFTQSIQEARDAHACGLTVFSVNGAKEVGGEASDYKFNPAFHHAAIRDLNVFAEVAGALNAVGRIPYVDKDGTMTIRDAFTIPNLDEGTLLDTPT